MCFSNVFGRCVSGTSTETPQYDSPEQWLNDATANPSSDQDPGYLPYTGDEIILPLYKGFIVSHEIRIPL